MVKFNIVQNDRSLGDDKQIVKTRNSLLHLRETLNALQLFFFFFLLCQPCPNIGASHIWDFRPCHDVKIHVCCGFFIPSEKRIRAFERTTQAWDRGLPFRKNQFLILYNALRKLSRLLSLLITNYLSVYSIYLFYLSI